MRRIVELCLYRDSVDGMCRWLMQSNPPFTRQELIVAAQEQTLQMQNRKSGKKLSLHKSTCIGVQEAIGNLKGKRLELFEKRAQKQQEYEQRVRKATALQAANLHIRPAQEE